MNSLTLSRLWFFAVSTFAGDRATSVMYNLGQAMAYLQTAQLAPIDQYEQEMSRISASRHYAYARQDLRRLMIEQRDRVAKTKAARIAYREREQGSYTHSRAE